LFPYIPVLTDDLVENMCLGLRKRAAPVNEEILHYAGPRSKNRKKTLCRNGDCCTGQTKASGPNKGYKLTCDEYPFNSAVEGGAGAHVGCIVDFQNGVQGGYLGPFYKDYHMKRNSPFLVRITGIDCDTVHEDDIPKCNKFGRRMFADKRESIDLSKGVFLPADAGNSKNRLIIPLGDVAAGE
jgi:hypothetical protein